MPCNVDIATQEILKLAEIADPDGVRTMGVLTKPDLVAEKVNKDAVLDLLNGKRNTLKLGYYVVKNRSADDYFSTIDDRLAAENAFFMAPPWSSVANRCGIPSLQIQLRELLMFISKRELPHVKEEINTRLRRCREDLSSMGQSRADQNSQRLYLGKIASRFQAVTQWALNGHYTGDKLFLSEPTLKLATRMISLNEAFSDRFMKRGHKRQFGGKWENGDKKYYSDSIDDTPFEDLVSEYPELSDIICRDQFGCPEPLEGQIIDRVKVIYKSSRGPEIGTFNGTILATAFEEQSEKWEPLVLSHASYAIAIVHDYITRLFVSLCPEKQVRDQLWNDVLVDKLCEAYREAMSQAKFLLAIERQGRPITFNHQFNSNLKARRTKRMKNLFKTLAVDDGGEHVHISMLDQAFDNQAFDKASAHEVCEDIVDTLTSYYEVSRKRFVDTVCQQVVNHFLLDGEESPLKILSPELVMNLDPELIEMIAGEDAGSRRQRQLLGREIERLEAATKVLRA